MNPDFHPGGRGFVLDSGRKISATVPKPLPLLWTVHIPDRTGRRACEQGDEDEGEENDDFLIHVVGTCWNIDFPKPITRW